MRPLLILPLAAACGALLFAGCGSSDPAPTTSTLSAKEQKALGGMTEEAPRAGARTVGDLTVAAIPGATSATVYDTPQNRQLKYIAADPKVTAMLSVAPEDKAPSVDQILGMIKKRPGARTSVREVTMAGAPATRIVHRPANAKLAAVVVMGPVDGSMVTILANAPVAAVGKAEALADALARAISVR